MSNYLILLAKERTERESHGTVKTRLLAAPETGWNSSGQ